MNSFDGSTGNAPPPGLAALPASQEQQSMPGLDTLTLLKQTVAERVDVTTVDVTAPGGRIRLVCHNDIPEKQLRYFQRASLPVGLRKTGGTSLDQNQMTIAVSVLVYAVMRIEVMDAHDAEKWHVVENAVTTEPLTLKDEAVLHAFNAIDTQYALIKIFGRESDVIRASQQVLAASGWVGENGGDEFDDPR